MRILLLSAYDAQSHQYWRKGLVAHLPEHEWTVLSLPARYFSWRIRGNSLSWALGADRHALAQAFDLIVATSMTDLATLRGLVPALAKVPAVLYFHENQFFYPTSERAHHSVEPQMVTLYSALAADRLLFNSSHNYQTFLEGVDQLLARLPDCVPAGVCAQLAAKARVLPVPITPLPAGPRSTQGRFELVWNHRREYDKGPELLLRTLQALPPELPLTVHVLGQSFRRSPSVFTEVQALLGERGWLGRWGYLPEKVEYHALLGRCHAVLSTALHDFQGLAVLEAVSAGCIPVLPDRLAYPQWFEPGYLYGAQPDEAHAAAAKISGWVRLWQQQALPDAPDIGSLYWEALLGDYRKALELG